MRFGNAISIFDMRNAGGIYEYVGSQLSAGRILLLYSAPNQTERNYSEQDSGESCNQCIMKISKSYRTSELTDDDDADGVWLILALLAGGFGFLFTYAYLKR
jgi:hypothetical protein